LRIIDADLAARVDARRADKKSRYLQSRVSSRRMPEKAHGRYLLTGGLLVGPTCGGHFEVLLQPWKKDGSAVYVCSTRRRKPGACTNTLTLPMRETDETILSLIQGEVLNDTLIHELLAAVDAGPVDDRVRLTADKDRLRAEIDRLVGSIAAGVDAATVAPAIKQRETDIASIDARLTAPTPARVDMDALRAALENAPKSGKRRCAPNRRLPGCC
jgi:hypothetical protein